MSEIFKSTDVDGDSITVRRFYGSQDELIIESKENDTHSFVLMNKTDAEGLYEALGQWLYGSLDEYDSEAIAAANERKARLDFLLDEIKEIASKGTR